MKNNAVYGIFVFLICVGICLSGCQKNQPPKIFPALPTTITISTNQIYYYDLINHQSDDRDEPEQLRWSLTKIGNQLFFAEINPPKQLVLTSQEQAGSDNITLILTDSGGRSVAQELEVIINDQLPGPIEGEVDILENAPNMMFELRGERVMYVKVGEKFIDPGASALDTYDGPLTVTIVSTVNTAVLGTYTITYTATDSSGNTATLVRIVHVVDLTPPVITIKGDNPASANRNVPYRDAGALVTDNCGGLIDIDVINTVNTAIAGNYTVTYIATDASGNSSQAIRTVIVGDQLPPLITILGSNPVAIGLNSTYTDAGATAIDNGDGDLTAQIQTTSTVDTSVLGAYLVTYSVTDSSGNTATASREVRVEEIGIEITFMPPYGEEGYIIGKVTGVTPSQVKMSLVIQYLELWYIKETLDEPSVTILPDGTFYYWYCSHVNDKNATAFYFTLLPIDAEPELCVPCFSRPEHPEAIATLLISRDPNARDLWFSGHKLITKYSGNVKVDPGPMYYANTEESIWVDGEGKLHLRLIIRDGVPYGVEFITEESVGYGTICVTTLSQLDNLQLETVLGLFLYNVSSPTTSFDEIDILEVAKWLQELLTNMQNVLQPCSSCPSASPHCHRFNVDTPDGQPELTHYLVWQPGSLEFRTYFGKYSLTDLPPTDKLVNQWVYTGADVPIPSNSQFRTNIWQVNGLMPGNGQEVEVVLGYLDWQSTVPNWDLDTVPPVITISGDNPLTHEAVTEYVDAGAIAFDDIDGDVTASIQVDNTINVNLLGTYTVTYTVTDSQGNEAMAVRTVNVIDTTPPVIQIEGELEIEVPGEDIILPGENLSVEILAVGYAWGQSYLIGTYAGTGSPDCAIAIDSQDHVKLLYFGTTGLVLLYLDNGQWRKKSSWPTALGNGRFFSLEVAPDDACYIAWITLPEKMSFMNNRSGSWINQVVNGSSSIGLTNSLAWDSIGNIVMSYWQWTSGGWPGSNGNLFVSQNHGTTTWETTALGSATWYTTNTLIDSLDKIHIIHCVGNSLTHTTNASGQWLSENTNCSANWSSAVIDGADKIWAVNPYGVTTNASGSWVKSDIFTTLLPGVSSNNLRFDEDALALDSQGNLHFCFLQCSDYSSPTKWQSLIYVSNLLGSWQAVTVDTWSVGASDYRYLFPSLELDSQDQAHIVYYNLGDNQVRYMSFDPYAAFGETK